MVDHRRTKWVQEVAVTEDYQRANSRGRAVVVANIGRASREIALIQEKRQRKKT